MTTRFATGSVLLSAALSGCLNLTPPATAVQSHGLALGAVSSADVQVHGPWLQMNHGRLEIAGSIAKRFGASTTAFSHLDILFCDNAGRTLQVKPIRFVPRSVGHSRFASQRGYYSLNLDTLPQGTARIEVRAHDGNIASPHS